MKKKIEQYLRILGHSIKLVVFFGNKSPYLKLALSDIKNGLEKLDTMPETELKSLSEEIVTKINNNLTKANEESNV